MLSNAGGIAGFCSSLRDTREIVSRLVPSAVALISVDRTDQDVGTWWAMTGSNRRPFSDA
jgi:hypothetical protein